MAIEDDQRLARKQRRQQGRRDDILAAARKVLLSDGWAAMTIAAVARQADISPPSVYYYFRDKDELAQALAIDVLTAETDAVKAAVHATSDPADKLAALVKTRVDHYTAQPEAFQLMWVALSGMAVSTQTLEEQIYPLSQAALDPIAEALGGADLYNGADPRRLANIAFCLSQGILSTSFGIARAGGQMRYATDALVDEACALLRQAVGRG